MFESAGVATRTNPSRDVCGSATDAASAARCSRPPKGINPKIDLKKVIKVFKKEFACNGTVIEDPEFGQVIQLQGDQRNSAAIFLTKQGICAKDAVKVHGG